MHFFMISLGTVGKRLLEGDRLRSLVQWPEDFWGQFKTCSVMKVINIYEDIHQLEKYQSLPSFL